MKNAENVEGRIFAVNKPLGMTSHDVVAKIKKATGVKKVGHAGTLDPLAEGVLVIGVGRTATKKLGMAVEEEKEYLADIRLGADSTTDDEEGEKKKYKIAHEPTMQDVKKATREFVGKIRQLSPRYSAVKIHGERSYKKARRGESFSLPPRDVEIRDIRILEYEWPKLKLKVTTGAGVYIRSLARDIGRVLGTGGYLTGLKRTRVGNFMIDDAFSIEDF